MSDRRTWRNTQGNGDGLVIKRQIFCRLSLTGNLNIMRSALAMIFYVELKVVSGLTARHADLVHVRGFPDVSLGIFQAAHLLMTLWVSNYTILNRL